MNIFSLDFDWDKNAQFHPDSYIVKLPLESAQIACTAYRLKYGDSKANEIGLYRKTHVHHPLVKWAAGGISSLPYNLISTVVYGQNLAKEYTYRYEKIHKCTEIFNKLWSTSEFQCADYWIDGYYGIDYNAPLCMPDYCKIGNRIESYREYFIKEKLNKIRCKWTKRKKPEWLNII